MRDTDIMYQEKYGIGCIGSTKDKKEEINCFQRTGPINEKIEEYISYSRDNILKLEERKKVRDKIIKEHFKMIKIK